MLKINRFRIVAWVIASFVAQASPAQDSSSCTEFLFGGWQYVHDDLTRDFRGIKSADVNGDGISDFIAIDRDHVRILLGDGNGRMDLFGTYDTEQLLGALDVADIDGDKDIDIVVVNGSDADYLVLINLGSGLFNVRGPFTTISNPQTVSLGDMNGDGLPELAIGGGGSAGICIYQNNGSGEFSPDGYCKIGHTTYHVRLADVNGD